MGTREYQARVRSSLADLPGPSLRPGTLANRPRAGARPLYILRSRGASSPAWAKFPKQEFTLAA
jgi:hypothetical protein